MPAQSEVQRQLPLAPLAHDVLEQHLTVDASAGHAPLMVVPPAVVQSVVVMQTPLERTYQHTMATKRERRGVIPATPPEP